MWARASPERFVGVGSEPLCLGHGGEIARVAAVVVGDRQGVDDRAQSRERREDRGGILAGQAGEQDVERRGAGESLADIGRDLARRGGIMAAVDPEFASGGERREQRAASSFCSRAGQSAQPIAALSALGGTSSPCWWRSMAMASAAFIAWWRPGRRGTGSASSPLKSR